MSDVIRPIAPRHHKIVYKLTDQNMRTYGGYQWKLNTPQQTSGIGSLCTSGWLHVSSHPDIAVLLNPIYLRSRAIS